MNEAEQAAVEVLDLVESSNRPAGVLLKRTLRQHPEFDNDQRKRVATLVHGVRCHRLRLRFVMDQLGRGPKDLFRTYDEDQARSLSIRWPDDPIERLSIERSIPRWIAARFAAQFGADADRVAAWANTPGPLSVRANTLQNDRHTLIGRLASENITARVGSLGPNALRVERPADIRGSPSWQSGCFEVQDEASQLVAASVDARPGETIVDLCAGAGGKTLALAADMDDEGLLYACDVDGARLQDLRVRLGRVPLRSVRVVDLNTEDPPSGVDAVLVDAPCSATGTWRRGPDRKWRVTPEDVDAFTVQQTSLLNRAAQLIKGCGRIIYATCSLLAAENDDRIVSFLESNPNFEATSRWILPYEYDTDGFFISVLRVRE